MEFICKERQFQHLKKPNLLSKMYNENLAAVQLKNAAYFSLKSVNLLASSIIFCAKDACKFASVSASARKSSKAFLRVLDSLLPRSTLQRTSHRLRG